MNGHRLRKQDITEIERAVLWELKKRDSVASNVSILGSEPLRRRFDPDDLRIAWQSLLGRGLVTGKVEGGGIGSATTYKALAGMFRGRWFWYRLGRLLKKPWDLLWGLMRKRLTG